MRELRALFAEAKKEAEKDEPDGVKLKALLADANEMVAHLHHPRSGVAGRPARRQDVRAAVARRNRGESSDHVIGNFVGGASFLGAACVRPASSRC